MHVTTSPEPHPADESYTDRRMFINVPAPMDAPCCVCAGAFNPTTDVPTDVLEALTDAFFANAATVEGAAFTGCDKYHTDVRTACSQVSAPCIPSMGRRQLPVVLLRQSGHVHT